MSVDLRHGDCREAMRAMAADGTRVDAVCCDPPYHLASIVKRFAKAPRTEATVGSHAYGRHATGFMGKAWDGGDIAFQSETWRLCYDLMKPGAYIIAFSSSRTFGRMSVAIEDAGFITHPMLGWLFATGFPKATRFKAPGTDGLRYGAQALKPALEPIYMGQKPMEGTGTENWLQHGTGAINIDGCRIGSSSYVSGCERIGEASAERRYADKGSTNFSATPGPRGGSPNGRWPANICHDGSDEVLAAFPNSDGQIRAVTGDERSHRTKNAYGEFGRSDAGMEPRGDVGSAARFFFSGKAGPDDRCDSRHPTVKPVALMRWLARLITPPGGTVLDPFAGSGTTGVACIREGFDCILIEREDEYAKDIRHRLDKLSGLDTAMFAPLKKTPQGSFL